MVEIESSISPKQEFTEFLRLFKDWRMLALFPMFFSSNYCASLCPPVAVLYPDADRNSQSTRTKAQSPQSCSTAVREPSYPSSPDWDL